MDAWEATKAVFDRVHALDPENASKMMGLLLIQDNSDKELIRLAFGPDHLLHAFMAAALAELGGGSGKPASPPLQTGAPWGVPSPAGGDHHRRHGSPFASATATDQLGYDDGGGADALYAADDYGYDVWSPAGGGGGGAHRRSFSLSDAEAAASWRPCMYYARGYCKNGSSCRFLHGAGAVPEDDAAAAEREMAVVMRAKALAAAAAAPPAPVPPQHLMASAYPFSPSPKGGAGVSLGFLLQQHQQQSETQRAAAAAAGMLLGGEDMHRFPVRSPRMMMDRGDMIGSPAARQIYLTFPADSTFSEEDVSNYFSMFGPVQDVRIPYQQKRMFGFVTFVYAETVKAILSKGNPHFVCDARVLVKPYKEKGKVPDRFRKLQHAPHHGVAAGLPLDARDPYDLQQPQIGPRMMYANMANNHEAAAFLRRKLAEERQQAEELQQAIELEGRRFMGLQLLDDLKSQSSRVHHHHLGLGSGSAGSPMSLLHAAAGADGKGSSSNGNNGNASSHLEDVIASIQDSNKKMMSRTTSSLAMSAPAAAAADAEGKHEEEQQGGEGGDGSSPKHKQAVNPGEEEEVESGPVTATPNAACGFQESGVVEHILPDSPFASPTKASRASTDTIATATAQNGSISNSSPHHVASSLFPPAYNSCFFQVPRFSPGHEAIGL